MARMIDNNDVVCNVAERARRVPTYYTCGHFFLNRNMKSKQN